MRRRAEKLLAGIGVALDVTRPMSALSTAQEQLVQIAAAVGQSTHHCFDQPTSSLAASDAEALFVLIERLKARGLTAIYVSRRMPELFRLCDRISVLRAGRYVGTLEKTGMTHDAMVRMMVGRSEIAQAIFGLDARAACTIEVGDEPLRLGSVPAALRVGVGLVPEVESAGVACSACLAAAT